MCHSFIITNPIFESPMFYAFRQSNAWKISFLLVKYNLSKFFIYIVPFFLFSSLILSLLTFFSHWHIWKTGFDWSSVNMWQKKFLTEFYRLRHPLQFVGNSLFLSRVQNQKWYLYNKYEIPPLIFYAILYMLSFWLMCYQNV